MIFHSYVNVYQLVDDLMCALSPPNATSSAPTDPTFFGAPQVADEVLAARPHFRWLVDVWIHRHNKMTMDIYIYIYSG